MARTRRKTSTAKANVRRYVRDVVSGKVDDRTTRYAADVDAGRIVAGPWVRLAAARHLKDLERDDLVWDLPEANKKITHFPRRLRLSGGDYEGLEYHLFDWQAFCVGSLFGWKLPSGPRRFRKAMIEAGKGTGKSPLLAGIGSIGLSADGEPRAEIYFGAAKKEQAYIPFRDLVAMVELSPELSQRVLKIGKNPVWNLFYRATGSFAKPISGEGKSRNKQGGTQSGPRPHMGLLDELHEHPNAVVVDMLLAGQKNRRQPMTVATTNSGYDRNSVCWQWHEYSTKVVQGLIADDTWFAYICALDEGEDPFVDEGCWVKTNPSIDLIANLRQYTRDQVTMAIGMPEKANLVKRLNFCTWTQQAELGVEMDDWDKCSGEVDPEALAGRECFGGLDLGATADFTAFELYFPPVAGERAQVLSYLWSPTEGLLERERTDKAPYKHWSDTGLLRTTPGNSTDFDFVRRDIKELGAKYRIREIGFDPRDALQLATQLEGDGFVMVKVQQSFEGMAAGTHSLLRQIADHQLNHGGNAALRLMVSNVSLIPNAGGDLRPDKRTSRGRIDGFVGLVMAKDRADRLAPVRESLYNRRGAEEAERAEPVDPTLAADEQPPVMPAGALRKKSVYDSPEWQKQRKDTDR